MTCWSALPVCVTRAGQLLLAHTSWLATIAAPGLLLTALPVALTPCSRIVTVTYN